MSEAVHERTAAPSRRPVHLWVVAILALLWNSFGVFDYLATQMELESYVSQFTEQQRAYFADFPSWLVSAWALGVWGAFAGSIGLLLARGWAVWAFVVSLVGLAASTVYNFGMSEGAEVMGTAGIVMTVFIWVVALALLAYAVKQRKHGVLR
jgi:hypothetical protein